VAAKEDKKEDKIEAKPAPDATEAEARRKALYAKGVASGGGGGVGGWGGGGGHDDEDRREREAAKRAKTV
jgi:hypothetical protein